MNLVGKIFVVLVFIFSLVFMTMSVMVYATHRNWKEVVENEQAAPGKELGLKLQLKNAKAQLEELQYKKQQVENDLANEIALRARADGALQEKVTELDRARKLLEANEAKLKQSTDDAVAAMNATQVTLAGLRGEVEKLRDEIDTAREERDAAFKNVVSLEDKLAQATGELSRLQKRNGELTQDVAQLRLALQDVKIQLDRSGPPRVEGVILAVKPNGYVEISIGFDDGLEKGHELDVYRIGASVAESKFLGRVKVVQADPDRSVAQVLPDYKRGIIQREDIVATGLPSIRTASR